jgi:putative inorganic carbon (hco3(-)) transporter
MRKHEILVAIAGSLAVGIGAIILTGLPLKWAVAVIVGILLFAILLVVPSAQRVLLFALAFFISVYIGTGLPSFLTHLGHIGLSDSFDVQFIDILVLSLIMYRLERWVTQRVEIRFFPYTTIPALAWLGASALSGLNASEVDVTLIQVGQMAKLLLLYLVVANSIEDEVDIKWLMQGLLLGVLFQGLLGSYQSITGHTLGLFFLGEQPQLAGVRSFGTIGNSNGYGMFLAATLPVALALLFLEIRRLYKTLAIVVLSAGFLGLIFSLSRGAWLAFIVAFIIILVFASGRKRFNSQIAFVWGGSMLMALLIITLSLRTLIINRLTSSEANSAALDRITLAEGAIAMIQDYPILGVGLNNYALWMPKYDPYDYANQGKIVIVHNAFLLVTAETGLVGLAAFLWFLWSLFVQAWRVIKNARNDTVWFAGVAAFSSFTALAVHGMVDYDLLANVTVFRVLWLFAAVAAGLSSTTIPERSAITHTQMSESDNASF